MPTVGLNLLFLAPGETGGMETYARGLVGELVRAWPAARFVAFGGRELSGLPVPVVRLPVSARTRVRRVAAEQVLLPGAVARAGVDLVHSLGSTHPAWLPVPGVVTIHDLIYRLAPETHGALMARGMGVLVPLAARSAARVIVPSAATRDDVVRWLGVPTSRVDVVPEGPGVEAIAAPTPAGELRARLGLGDAPVIFSPSAKRPHKNLARLIEALASVPDAVLVVPGYANPYEAELRAVAAAAGVQERVRFTGWVQGADLEGLYALCSLVCFPSLVEGFGLPVLEAMRRGVPVACSSVSALPEVAGDAALLFDPLSVEAIAAALRRLLADPGDLPARGRARAAQFSWARAAEGTVASYQRVLSSA